MIYLYKEDGIKGIYYTFSKVILSSTLVSQYDKFNSELFGDKKCFYVVVNKEMNDDFINCMSKNINDIENHIIMINKVNDYNTYIYKPKDKCCTIL